MGTCVATVNREPWRPVVREADERGFEQTDIDSKAWTGFLARLRSYVGARVEPGSRDDVVGGILLRLVQHQDKLVAARDPMAWVTRVAANAVIDHTRRRASELRTVIAYGIASEQIDIGSPPDNPAAAEIAACVTPLIESLPEPYRDALKLVEIDGLSQRKAAERLGLSLSGTKSRVRRGRKKLKQALLRCCAIQLDRRGEVLAYRPRLSGCVRNCRTEVESSGTR